MKFTNTITVQGMLTAILIFFTLLLPSKLHSQTIYTEPALPTDAQSVFVYFDATGTALDSYTGDLYAHTGVIIRGTTQWRYVIGSWGNNTQQPKLERLGPKTYRLEIKPSIREFYKVPANEVIEKMAFVFRAAAGSPQSVDLFVDVYEAGVLSVLITNPPKDQPIVTFGDNITVSAAANGASSIKLLVNNTEVATSTTAQVEYELSTTSQGYGTHWIKAVASNASQSVVDSSYIFIRPNPAVAELPQDVKPGINYIDDSTVTLVLHDPPAAKDYVFVIGDFNDWMVGEEGYMNVTPSGTHFWITFDNLTPNTEYGFQYFIDNTIRIADPYTQKTLDPWNDRYISSTTYPNLKPYPTGKTTGVVSVAHPGKPAYQWQTTSFTPPAKEDLVIYELLIRDFVATSAIKTVMDSLDYLQRLGVNAIELMPFNEFEGNISWGYNPSFYFAPDKAYGTADDYKRFIDECHKRGIAVIMDIVLNHSFNLSPFVQMYFNANAGPHGQPTAENPWFLETCPHQPWCWGNTFDQNSVYTHELFNRITEYWMTEFKIDGFRFDFTKGFTNVQTGNQGSNYDAARIANLKRIADHMWSVNPNAYVILEHLTENSEERELANYGMMLWGNLNDNYMEASMGWLPRSDLNWGSYKARGWNNPHLIAYMESHDEERIMFKNLAYGNESGNYNVKDPATALKRAELAAVFYFPIPGPKMIWQFGELGYDFSINHCPNGTISNDCRTDPKPIRWDYYNDWNRRNLFNIYSLLIDLKKEEDVFKTTDFTLVTGNNVAGKRIHLNHASNQVTVLGNFGVTPLDINPSFQKTGTWHEYFSRQTLDVSNVNQTITLQPGEYRLYSSVAFPDHGIALSSDDKVTGSNQKVNVFPNPSNQGFTFTMDTHKQWHLQIINLQGQVVFEQQNALGASNNMFFWNSNVKSGKGAPAGVYFYQLQSAGETVSGKIMVR
jgi:1,4-alpha-glucan branching enzyme